MIRRNKINVVSETLSTAQQNVNEKLWWRNMGGTFKLNKSTVIKPNQKFQAYEHEISKAFRDVIIPMGVSKPVETVAPVDVKKTTYTMQPSTEEGMFDIYNSIGKKMTEKPLDEETANNIIKDLQS
jgi:hypothetical protein